VKFVDIVRLIENSTLARTCYQKTIATIHTAINN